MNKNKNWRLWFKGIKQKHILCSHISRNILTKVATLQIKSTDSSQSLRVPAGFSVEIDPKICIKIQEPKAAKNNLKKNKVGGFT